MLMTIPHPLYRCSLIYVVVMCLENATFYRLCVKDGDYILQWIFFNVKCGESHHFYYSEVIQHVNNI